MSARDFGHRERRSHELEVGDLRLHAVARGSRRDLTPVLLLHGFTGSAQTMGDLAEALLPRPSVCLDLVGHGRSEAPRNAAPYAMDRVVAQLRAALDALEIPRAHLLGYSMGGRIALQLCVAHPARIASALVIGASAGFADPAVGAARRRSDAQLAARIEAEGVPAFVDSWMALPLFASQKRLGPAALARARRQRLDNRSRGLANALRGMGAGSQEPLQARLASLLVPLCIVAGAEDAKFRAIASELVAAAPTACHAVIEKAGHAAHLENPEALRGLARSFFAEVDAAAGSSGLPDPSGSPNPSRSPHGKEALR